MAHSTPFSQALQNLTKEQRLAVETVEGPVAVLAGPGTGKTHILTLRIANILQVTQARPDAILALTFTDSAARTMRARLADLIGVETARRVLITTFHGFATHVRSDYPGFFVEDADKRLMGEVEETLLLREAIDTASLDTLRPPKRPYTYLPDLKTLYHFFMREGIRYEDYRAWKEEAVRDINADPTLRYKKGPHVGKPTKVGLEKAKRFLKVEEAIRVFERYDELKEERRLTDFSEMLAQTVQCIHAHEELRSALQERYQYILADEHQDANALQHRLLTLFAYDDYPNIFIVGDDKQTIYRFQGAEADAFTGFTQLFPRATVITLTSSFRSYQHILDAAHSVVGAPEESARLIATRKSIGKKVSRIIATDILDERAKVTSCIKSLIKKSTAPHEIAVITRTNKTAHSFARALAAEGVPVIHAGDLSFTERPIMHPLVSLARYCADPLNTGALREALFAPWWEIDIRSLLVFLRTTRDRDLVSSLAHKYPQVARTIEHLVREAPFSFPAPFFSSLLAESGARDYLLTHANHLDDFAWINALTEHLESAASYARAVAFPEAFTAFTRAYEHGLSPLQTPAMTREGFVTIITAHKAKGMEFSRVFIPQCVEKEWEGEGRPLKIPSPYDNTSTLADARRLFFVALSRAKDHAYLSYSSTGEGGRDTSPTVLIPPNLPETRISAANALPSLHAVIKPSEKIRELTESYLAAEGLSPSAINDYLESPPLFFARRVLHIQEPPALALEYGRTLHAALAKALTGSSLEEAQQEFTQAFSRAPLPRDASFEKARHDAHTALTTAFPALPALGKPLFIEKDFSLDFPGEEGASVSIGGKIDAVFEKNGRILVVDFKTGTNVSAKNESYERQIILYALMLAAAGERPSAGLLVQVSSKGMKEIPVPLGEEQGERVREEVRQVIYELRSGNWRQGAPSAYDALWELLNTQE